MVVMGVRLCSGRSGNKFCEESGKVETTLFSRQKENPDA